ncbi:hypothetical protein C8K36_1011368 [Rhodococcus sp. OK519]|uniref:DUF6226 family protein n=1 Tax=Rhodococcus sp. OK519 TaxID=2135729 RepID=UPI000D38E94E|nr:hypothetical protein C8K36_1011368 [Rhodococcus sp. OK519]
MGSETGSSWWVAWNGDVRRFLETGRGGKASVLSREVCELLDDVDAAFAVAGAHTPQWPDPQQDGPAPGEDAYERVTDPDKFLIVVARARAWAEVLLGRGWAREAPSVEWALRPFESGGADTVLAPVADGAVPLVLTTHTPVDSNHIYTVTVAAGDPAVRLAEVPDCGCDGCDRGSAELLRDMDQWVLSIVGGSLEVDLTLKGCSVRTSFGGEGGTVQHVVQPAALTAASWSADWTPRFVPEY